MSKGLEAFTVLEWDSQFWGCKIARLSQVWRSPAALKDVLFGAQKAGVACVYYLVNADDVAAIEAAARLPFEMVDLRLSLTAAPRACDLRASGIRPATLSDVPRLRAIAAKSHSDTRFYRDHKFSRQRCDELYSLWVEKSVIGELADAVFVCDSELGVAGYVTCRAKQGVGEIGLVAVAEEARGRGQGTALLNAALNYFDAGKCREVRVVTQGRNLAAQRLYARKGFNLSAREVWYHAWPLTADFEATATGLERADR